jgi:integrase
LPRNTRRVRLEPGIYREGDGFSAIAVAGSKRKERHFQAGTALKTIRQWREDTRTALRAELAKEAPRTVPQGTSTLKQDVQAYIKTIRGTMTSWKSRRSELDAWAAAFPKRTRASLTRLDLATQLDLWARRGVAVRTLNKRRNALIQLFTALDGPAAPNPARETKRFREPDREIRAIAYDDLAEVLRAMPDRGRPKRGTGKKAGKTTSGHPPVSLTKLRLAVMLYTGLPPVRIARILPEHLDLPHARVWLVARLKGKGRPGKWHPLTPKGVAAFEAFRAAKAFGAFSTSSARKSLHTAIDAVNEERRAKRRPILPRFRPYDLRHSFASEALRRSQNLRGVQALLDHADLRTTLQYVEAAVSDLEQATLAAMAEHQGPDVTLPRVTRSRRKRTPS